MNGCEGFEIATLMRLHGTADRDASERLDAHLATCQSCRRFETAVIAAEKTMRAGAIPDEAALDATRMWERIRRAQREHWITPLVVAAGFFFFIAIAALDAWWYDRTFVFATYPRVILLFAAVLGLFLLRSAQTVYGLHRAERSREDLLRALRRDVDRRFRATLFTTIVIGGLALFHLLLWPFTTPMPGASLTRHGVGFLLLVAALLGGTVYGFSVSLPRLRRERAELR